MPFSLSMTGCKVLCLLALTAALGERLSEAQQGIRYAITREQIASTLSSATSRITAEEIQLPGVITSRQASPALDVLERTSVLQDTVRVRLHCHIAGDCLPFLALVHFSTPMAAEAFLASAAAPPRKNVPPSQAFLKVQAGERTTFVLASPKMLIRLPAILIDCGGLGTEVRVASLDRKQTFHGRVVARDEVRGELP